MAAAAAIAFVPVGEYLGSVYRPDVDYVDGVLVERNVGEFGHGKIQRALMLALIAHEAGGGYYTIQEQRVQITASRFRVPDVCLLRNEDLPDAVVYDPPLLCVEVLSPRDTVHAMRERSQDYLQIGVPEVWILDGSTRSVFVLSAEGFTQRMDGLLQLPGTSVEINANAVFSVLDSRTAR